MPVHRRTGAALAGHRAGRAVGSPVIVGERLSSLAATDAPDELMLPTPVYDIDDRFRSLDLVLKHAVRPTT
jgi:hypothetical protein